MSPPVQTPALAPQPPPEIAPAQPRVDERLLWILSGLIWFAGLSLALRPEAALRGRPLTEDGFFSLAVARQLALGHGLTIDGVHWVNGFQPLFTVVCALPFAWVGGDRAGGLRGVLVLHALVHACGAWACGLLARDAVTGVQRRRLRQALGTAAYALSPAIFLTTFNGLETGAVLALLAWIWRYWQVTGGQTLRQLATAGALLGLLVLTRIDAALFVVIVTVGVLVSGDGAWWGRVQRAAAIALPAGLVSAPWWLYNYLGFGSLMPTSGRALTDVGVTAERTLTMLQSVQMSLVPLTYVGAWESFWLVPVRLLLIVLIVVGVRRARRDGDLAQATPGVDRRAARTGQFARWIGMTLLVFVGYYWATSAASWFYGRYLAAIGVPMTVYSAIALSALGGWQARLRGTALTVAAGALLFGVWRLHTSARFAGAVYVDDQLALVLEHVPPGDAVAAGQTGTLGFFRERVVNLDGKVNRDALVFRHDIAGYLRRTNVQWFCDWPHFATRYLADPPGKNGWKLVAQKGQFQLYHRPTDDPTPAER